MNSTTPIAMRCVSIDLEIHPRDETIDQIGAVRGDREESFRWERSRSKHDLAAALERLEEFARGSEFLLGHNLIAFDAPRLKAVAPGLRLLGLPMLDTLRLNPLAFPKHPYHKLVKHYQDGKLLTGRRNDPESDARLALQLFREQCERFNGLVGETPALVAAWHHLTGTGPDGAGFDRLFAEIRRSSLPSASESREPMVDWLEGRACRTRARRLLDGASNEAGWPLAYALAWISVAGGNSVLAPWVLHQFPESAERIAELRDRACLANDCGWCRDHFDSRRALARWFKHPEFRPEPKGADGTPLQKTIVDAAMAGEHVLGILPTGTGKSICYQLPALARYEHRGALTVVISPLVALMTDQVDGLRKRGVTSAEAITGMLSMPERGAALDRVRLGDVAILLVSPEQLRSRAVSSVLQQREIGSWVLDEAHCLSKWGPDFRPDYRYVGRFIRDRSRGRVPPPILALTATAKRDVVDEIVGYFRKELALEMRVFDGGSERTNLDFEVVRTEPERRLADIVQLLHAMLLQEQKGGAIIYCSTRRRTEELASALSEGGIEAGHYHAGLTPELKKDLQKRFIGGELRVMTATNAFGMGIDKDDVRLVIHADLPGSLENYLQEAGRAGRDQKNARCVLMWNTEDVERQFRMSERSNLSRREIDAILKAIERIDKKRRHGGEIVVTSGEILTHESDGELLRDGATDDTRVRTAISWLEEAKLLVRDENRVEVFPASLRVKDLEEAKRALVARGIAEPWLTGMTTIVRELLASPPDRGLSTDELMAIAGMTSDQIKKALRDLERCGIATDDTQLTAFVHVGVERSSRARFEGVVELERALLDLMAELAPGLGKGDSAPLYVRRVTQQLKDAGFERTLPEHVWRLLRSISEDGREESGAAGSLSLRRADSEVAQIELRREWPAIRELAGRRRDGAARLLDHFLSKLPKGARGLDQRVETTLGALRRALEEDLLLKAQARDLSKLLDRSLLWLHEQEVLRLGKGLTIFCPAMTIRLPTDRRRFAAVDFEPLEAHYREKRAQIHVMATYANRGIAAIADALRLVRDYFAMARAAFLAKWLPGSEEELARPTTRESWNAIVEELSPAQRTIVTDDDERANLLVLAGPGSGKTRVLVHRIAYLVRVRREEPRGILALAYNRHAAVEIRRRLAALIGDDARGVTVLTCHALAMRLAGVALDGAKTRVDENFFDEILKRATELLRGDGMSADDADEQRARLLAGFRWILVDEYQDVAKAQYELIAALAGRTLNDKEDDRRLNLFAVGDDDQNIYSFNGASVEFIRRFETDYQAKSLALVENFRSTAHIIAAANALIAPAAQRMKLDRPITIDRDRRGRPAGGDWETLDPVGRGRVQVLPVGTDRCTQAVAVVAELRRLASLDPRWDWSQVAVIAREWRSLEPVRNECARLGIASQLADEELPKLFRMREGDAFLSWLRRLRPAPFDAAAVRGWVAGQIGGPWWSCVRDAVEEYVTEHAIEAPIAGAATGAESANRAPSALPVDHFIDWFHEWCRDLRRRTSGLLLLTAHRAKGLEFDHVAVLDGNWDRRGRGEDPDAARRLLYVAMTRARRTLLLGRGEGEGDGSDGSRISAGEVFPFDAWCNCPAVFRRERTPLPAPAAELRRSVRVLKLDEVDLDFAGRQSADHPIHAAIAALGCGDRLELVREADRLVVRDRAGRAVGRLAAKLELSPDLRASATVAAIIVRTRRDCGSEYERLIRVDRWELVVPEITIDPGG